MSRIIDIHSHFIPLPIAQNTAFFKNGWSDLDRQLSMMDEHGIEQAVLLYPTSDAHLNMGGWGKLSQIYNRAIADVCQKYPDRFVGAGIIPPENIFDGLKNLMDLNLRMISLASSYDGQYLDSEIFFPLYEFAQKHDLPIHVHPQIMNSLGHDRLNDPLLTPVLSYVFDVSAALGKMMMAGVFDRFANVKFIFAHFGGVLPVVKERFDNTYLMLRKRNFVKDLGKTPGEYFKNLYFDNSGSRSSASLEAALEIVDSSHLLFGSDYPANQDLAGSIKTILTADLSDEDKAFIFDKNFKMIVH